MINNTGILLRHNYVSVPAGDSSVSQEALATVMMNISYYGFALSLDAYKAVSKLNSVDLADWWHNLEVELKDITGANRKMGDFVVYKNFPAEVLAKSDVEYWLPQILMYWGFPNEMFTTPAKPREKMNEKKKATVLRLANKDTLKGIFNSYLSTPARWKDEEFAHVLFLSDFYPVNVAKLAFKENLVHLATDFMSKGKEINVSTATDVLRLAAGISDGDVSLREKVKFKSFKKPVRRYLLSLMEKCKNLQEDMARRPELWKRLVHQLHPGDYKRSYPNVCRVMDELYKDHLETFNSKIEKALAREDASVLTLLQSRPGEFRRRLVHTVDLFGDKAVKAFTNDTVLNGLTTAQVVSTRKYLDTVNNRYHRVFPPKGNWNKAQVNEARWVDEKRAATISKALGKNLSKRLPKVKELDPNTAMVALPNNGETGPYARGTVFPIPNDVKFIRTASYWKNKSAGNTWFDNGWNFFDSNWKSLGACCWNAVKFGIDAAVFSGDPTNSKEMEGRAAQMIDLYPDALLKQGVRYAVWNILCFSRIPFSNAEEVYAALQWGADAQKGKLFEPSRCQLSFPLSGNQMTKYICVIDLLERKMIYVDANLRGHVQSANSNGAVLEKNMPAFMEYIASLPTVYDLFCESVDKKSDGPHILYSDKNAELKNVSAYVFKPENKENKYKAVDLNGLLT